MEFHRFKSYYLERIKKMSNLFTNQRLYKKNINLLKKDLYCFKNVKNYLFKTNIIFISKYLFIELNLARTLKIMMGQTFFSNKKKSLNFLLVKKNKNCSLFANSSLKKIERFFFVIFFLKKIFLSKTFLKARIIHFFKNGFIVILNGLVCFLPINNCSYINFQVGRINIFFISFFSENNFKTIVLSQKDIHKKINSNLVKMTSRLIFLKKILAYVT